MYKKCTFPKMGTKKHNIKKKTKGLSPRERYDKLKEWKDGWF